MQLIAIGESVKNLDKVTDGTTAMPTPTTPNTPITADLHVDDDNTTGMENGSVQHPYNYVSGGIYAADSNISILDNTIRNNISGRGGGIAIDGRAVPIQGSTVVSNTGVSDHGGSLYIASPSVAIFQNVIAGNEIGQALGYGWGGRIIVSA